MIKTGFASLLIGVLLLGCTAEAFSIGKKRKGFALDLAVGVGNSNIYSPTMTFNEYSVTGIYIDYALGWAPSNHSRITFGLKSNIFPNEVGKVYNRWVELMQRDNLGGFLATIVSPFVFLFSPFFRSHGMLGNFEYLYFFREKAPSLFLSGAIGLGLIYETNENIVTLGRGFSGAFGYEFAPNFAIIAETLYTRSIEYDVRALSFMVGLRFMIY